MAKYFIIADDLTGANASGILLKKLGLKTLSLTKEKQHEIENYLPDYDVITISTESRGIEKEKAYEAVANIAFQIKNKNFKLINKRIDSTLRGNIGAEIDAVLDSLKDFVAVMVPAFPSSGRITIGGRLLVNGIPLHKTEAAKDPKAPVKTSSVMEILQKQSQKPSIHFPIDFLSQSDEICIKTLKEHLNKGYKIFVFDATDEEDIDKIARIWINLNIKFFSVDPGPFTYSLAKQMEGRNENDKKILMVIGSVTDTTYKQLNFLKIKIPDLEIINVNPKKLISENEREKEINRAFQKTIEVYDEKNLICVTTINHEKLDLQFLSSKLNQSVENLSVLINTGLAEIAHKLINSNLTFHGIFSSGGDTTIALLNKLEAHGVELLDEILPLAVAGKIINGIADQINIATKGGMIGDEKGIYLCISHLQKMS